ncbi:hypothetical protein WJX77_010459 [Trebouxia sp. C0004]
MLVHGEVLAAQWPYHALPTLESWQVKLGRAAAVHSKICTCCRGCLFAPSSHARLDSRHQARHISSSLRASAVEDHVAASTVTVQQLVTGLDTLSDGKSQQLRNAKPQVPRPAPSSSKYQELEAAAGKVSEEDLLAASSSTAHRYLFQQATKNDQLKSIPKETAAGSSPFALTPQDISTVSNITDNVPQQPVPDPQLLHTILISHLKGYDVLQRADLLWRGYRSSILELFLAKRHEDWAQDFVFKQQPNLPENVYLTLITLCSEHNSLKTLNAVLEAQCRAGGALTKAAFRKAKMAFDRVRDVDAVLLWFERAVASSMADTDVYCDAIESCINSRKYKIAFKIYDQLQRSGLELTLHSYHTVLKGSRHLQATGLQSLYAQMIADNNLVFKDKTFGYVFRAAATCGEGLPASWLIQVLSDMNTHRVQMNSHIFTAFLQACTVVPLAAHQIEAVFGAMASYRASQPPTAFVYTSLLTFCAKQAPDRALDVWQAMQEDGVPPSSYLLSSMFAACAAAGTQEMLEAADSSHMHMEGLWNKICSKGKTFTEEQDMLRAHNALLHVYASHGQVEKAKQLYRSMQERGPAIDAVSGSTIIAAYAKAADQKAALHVLDEMVSQGMKPTPQCYTSLLAACSRAGDLTAARRVFRTMHVDRNVAAYTALMDACLKKGTPAALDEAFQVFDEMKAAGNLKPTATTYGCLLMVCARQGDVDKAFLLYEEAYDTGVLATDECHNILIGICSDAGRVEEALDLVKALASKHGSMRQATLNSLIRSLLNVAQVPRALRMLSIMLNLGLKPYKSTVNALIAGCARDSSSVEAAKFYWGLREQGGEASRASGSELIISLCKAGDRLEALRVYEDMTSPSSSSHRHQAMTKSPSKSVARSNISSRRSAAKQRRKGVSTAVATVTTADSHHQATAHPSDYSNETDGNTDMASALHHSGAGSQHHYSGLPQPDSLSQQRSSIPAALPKDDSQHTADTAVVTAEGEVSSRHTSFAADLDPASAATQTHTHPGDTHAQDDKSVAAATEDLQHASSLTAAAAATPADKQNLASPLAKASSSSSSSGNSSQEMTTEAGSVLIRPSKRKSPQISTIAHDHSENHGLAIRPAEGGAQTSSHSGGQGAAQARGSRQDAGPGNQPTAAAGEAEAAAAAASGHGQLVSSLKLSQKPVFPSIGATAALVHAFAIVDDIHQCDRLYQQLQRDKRGLPGLTQSNRRMWESTIEAACRAGRTDWALQVFDDWKASSMTFMFVQPADQAKPVKLPNLSNATLAFLESCCRGSPEHEWRVYDVCAVMRQQKERKREAALARPAKKSHHVADAVW